MNYYYENKKGSTRNFVERNLNAISNRFLQSLPHASENFVGMTGFKKS